MNLEGTKSNNNLNQSIIFSPFSIPQSFHLKISLPDWLRRSFCIQQKMIECHFCGEPYDKIQAFVLAKCCIKKCSKYYCIECIKHFNPEFDMQMYKKETWICFSCQGICNCDKCKRQESATADKKIKKKQLQKSKPQGEESIELSSPTPIKIDPYLVVQPEPQPLISPTSEKESQDIEKEFKMHSEDEMILFPPFYRKIAERRNKYYNFVIKDFKKRKMINKNGREGNHIENYERMAEIARNE